MTLTCLTAKELVMKSLKDIQQLSLQLIVASMRDAEHIQSIKLAGSIQWLRKQQFPNIIIDLCKLGKRVETSLITGDYLFPLEKLKEFTDVFPLKDGSSLPSFCYPLFAQLFTESGKPRYILATSKSSDKILNLIDSDNETVPHWRVVHVASSAVLLLRQILLLFSKATDIPVQKDENDEVNEFISRTSPENPRTCIKYRPGLSIIFSHARQILSELLTPDGIIHPALAQWIDNPFGKHGPGAVAEREKGREKWNFWYDCMRLPSLLYSDVHGQPIGQEVTLQPLRSRLCVVPKDFRGHRLICAEPKELQFAQQGLLKVFEYILESSMLTSGHITLRDQIPSFRMSRYLKYGTIDLKDASDHITLRLLKILLPRSVYNLVTRFRSNGIILPDGRVIEQYNTAFTMGNALCFPIETLVFWSLSLATILSDDGSSVPNDHELVNRVRKIPLRVFGDDIIAPIEWVTRITEVLTAAGLSVNTDKTCKLTLVRESCGSWWYAGFDCRITKLKYSSTLDMFSWTSFQDVIPQLRECGMMILASELEDFCNTVYPTKRLVSFLLRRSTSDSGENQIDLHHYCRYNSSLQRMEYRCPMRTADDTRALTGRLGYLTWFTQSANRFLNANAQRVKFKWVELT